MSMPRAGKYEDNGGVVLVPVLYVVSERGLGLTRDAPRANRHQCRCHAPGNTRRRQKIAVLSLLLLCSDRETTKKLRKRETEREVESGEPSPLMSMPRAPGNTKSTYKLRKRWNELVPVFYVASERLSKTQNNILNREAESCELSPLMSMPRAGKYWEKEKKR